MRRLEGEGFHQKGSGSASREGESVEGRERLPGWASRMLAVSARVRKRVARDPQAAERARRVREKVAAGIRYVGGGTARGRQDGRR